MALKLFTDRGFDAVTVNEIAEAAEVAKATLFSYFPSKESLLLEGVGEDDLAGVVARRRSTESPLHALRAHYRTLAAEQATVVDRDEVIARMRVIFGSPALSGAANALLYHQRSELARVLTQDYGQRLAALVAAQTAAILLALQESFFHHLIGGTPPQEAARVLAEDTELAFGLLEHGIHHLEGH